MGTRTRKLRLGGHSYKYQGFVSTDRKTQIEQNLNPDWYIFKRCNKGWNYYLRTSSN